MSYQPIDEQAQTGRIGFLVGPGVLGHLDGLHAAAERIGVAVINTWGAKGVFRWDAPLHGGTAGLQERDFELGGLAEVDLLITSGLDPAEVTARPWQGRARVVDVEPSRLAELATGWSAPAGTVGPTALYRELSAVIGPLYGDRSSPPGRIRALSEGLEAGGVVLAAPGLGGFWVARAWPTTGPGTVVVPSSTEVGLVERLASKAAQSGRHAMLLSERQVEIPGVEVVVWDCDLTIPVELLAVAGPVVAWPELNFSARRP